MREWLARRSAPSGARAERLAELSSLVERLARVIRPTYIPVWLNKPVPTLDDDKPIDRIAAGDYRAVARLISGLEDPGASWRDAQRRNGRRARHGFRDPRTNRAPMTNGPEV